MEQVTITIDQATAQRFANGIASGLLCTIDILARQPDTHEGRTAGWNLTRRIEEMQEVMALLDDDLAKAVERMAAQRLDDYGIRLVPRER